MKINIYYGGRGLMDDPTLYVINKMQSVLEELHVEVERYNLYELKNTIPTLPQTQMELFWQQRWNGMELVDICHSSSMPAGYTGIRKRLQAFICVRL